MSVGEPLRGTALAAYRATAASLEQALMRSPHAAVVDVFANFVVRVALHGAERATDHHGVPSAVARGISIGLFHSQSPSTTGAKGV